ncbi:MAG: flagellar hook-associated protein 3 [bacterium]|nr:flagellar hook-associated protein 3 [bacterium]
MAMRPVEANWYRDFIFNLTNTKNRYDTAISQVSSGKKLNHLSDNPSDMSHVLNLRSKIGQIDQFERNINSAKGFLSTAESALSQTQNIMYSIVSLAEQGASESVDLQGRQAIADSIDQMRDEIRNFANTEIMGKYVFAGSYTDTVPFTDAGDTTLPSGVVVPGVVSYQGDSGTIAIQADFNISIDTNIPGDQVFTTPIDIFDRLSDLVVALRQDNTTGIANEIGNMNQIINQVSESISILGNRSAHINQIEGLLKSFKSSIQAKMSSLEDADMAQAISNLGREEIGLQATLQAGSRINRQSLMNYLG